MNWLILRGLVREQRHWGGFKDLFENQLALKHSNTRVFALDLPGFGTEVDRTSPRTIDGIVDDLRLRWMKLKSENEGNWNLLAVSLGGMVSANWTSRFPDDFEKLVMINSSMSGLSPIHHRMIPHNYPQILKLLVTGNLEARERKILSLTTNLSPGKIIEQAKIQAPYGERINKLNAINQMVAALQFKAPSSIQVPMMVLVGEGDRLVSPECSKAIARKYGALLKSHPTANHDLATDDPKWIAEQVQEWV